MFGSNVFHKEDAMSTLLDSGRQYPNVDSMYKGHPRIIRVSTLVLRQCKTRTIYIHAWKTQITQNEEKTLFF